MSEQDENGGNVLSFAGPDADLADFLTGDERRALAARRNTAKHRLPKPPASAHEKRHKDLNNRQLRFAAEYVFSGDRYAAFRLAYPVSADTPEKSVKFRADRLARSPKVKAEIERLREGIRKVTQVTGEGLSALCLEVVEMGRNEGNGELILKAVDRLARLHGLFQDKITVQNQQLSFVMRLGPDEPWIGDISPDDFRALEASTFEQLRIDQADLSQNVAQSEDDSE